jgi:hypothetical protein
VASPRPQTGKTFLARLVVDYLRLDRTDPLVFDVNQAARSPIKWPCSTVS